MSFLLRGCVALAVLCTTSVTVAAIRCPTLYANGTPPAVGSATTRTTEVCHTEYVLLASGVTKEPVYSAEHLTDQQVAGAEAVGRVGSFHDETGIPAADRSKKLRLHQHRLRPRAHDAGRRCIDRTLGKRNLFHGQRRPTGP